MIAQPCIVCLHGLGRSPADWDRTRPALDRIGAVASPQLPSSPAAALDLLDEVLAPGAIVIGHSMGGVLTMRLLTLRPRPLQAVVLTGCFFPPARNRRNTLAAIGDYLSHRAAFLRASRRERIPGTGLHAVAPLAALIRQTITGDRTSETALDQYADRVLVVHARDDHHVPVDYAIAAAHRHPGWTLEVLDRGGHHAHIDTPEPWSAPVTRWLTSRAPP